MTSDHPEEGRPFSMFTPGGALGQYVRAIWTLHVDASADSCTEQPIVPDGCPELVFNLGDPLTRLGARETSNDGSVLVGQMTAPVTVRPQGRVALVGVRLHPFALQALVGCGATELRDRIVPIDDGIDRSLRQRLATLDPASSPTQFAKALTRVLEVHAATRAETKPAGMTVHRALGQISRGGPTSTVRAVARSLGRSERQLQRVFEESVGLTPKLYLRILRVQRALRVAECNPARSWAAVSADCDFYDQSHLIRELLRFAGCTPSAFDAQAGILTRSLAG